MPDNVSDAPVQSQDNVQAEQQDQESWAARILGHMRKEDSERRPSAVEGFKSFFPKMLAMENAGSLPVCRTSC